MEEEQKIHIRQNLPGLLINTTCNEIFVATLFARDLLSDSDVATLDSIANKLQKTRKFYEIIVTRANSYEPLCEALHETKQSGALKILMQLSGAQTSLPDLGKRIRKRIRFDVRPPVQNFTGREADLATLYKNLSGSPPATAIVSGLGGIGKTELCLKYIEMHSEDYDGNVVWIGAERRENLNDGFKLLAKDHLHISLKDFDGGEKDTTTVVDEVYNFFSFKKCLFIFDNAVSNDTELFDTFMPNRVETKPTIIITSRDKEWGHDAIVLNVVEMEEADAIQFVKTGLAISNETEDDSIKLLVVRLQMFPLALQQSISFIKQRRIIRTFEISEYLELFDQNTEKFLKSKIPPSMANRYANTTFTTWKITTDVISADKEYGWIAICILNILSYLDPDKIPAELLKKLEDVEEENNYSALYLLVKYSMINSQPTQSTFSIHRLVQEVTRIELKTTDDENVFLSKCLSLFKPNDQQKISENLVLHAKSAFYYASNYKFLVVQFSWLPLKIVKQLHESTQLNEARLYCQKSLAVLSFHLDPQHIEILRQEVELAFLEERADHKLLKLQHVLKKYESLSLENIEQLKSEILYVKFRIGMTLFTLLKKQEGFKMLVDMFCEQKKTNCILNRGRVISNHSYSSCEMVAIVKTMFQFLTKSRDQNWYMIFELAYALGKTFGLEDEHGHAMEIWRTLNNFGEQANIDAARRLKTLFDIVSTYEAVGDNEKATIEMERLFETATPNFKFFPHLLFYGEVLAGMFMKRKQYSKAIEVTSKVHELRQTILGPNHSDTYESLHLLGKLKHMAGDSSGHNEMQISHVNLSKRVGNIHHSTLEAKRGLAVIAEETGKYMEALNLRREIYEGHCILGGLSHSFNLLKLAEMAVTLLKLQAHWSSWTLCTEIERTLSKGSLGSKSETESLRITLMYIRTYLLTTDIQNMSQTIQAFKSETCRRDSFSQSPGWKISFIPAEDCAEAGLFFLGVGVEVQCVFCGGIIQEWVLGQTARVEHKMRFPWCPFVMGLPVGNVETKR